MTVKFIAAINRWIGLSGDTKPTGVPVGSTFLAYDTGVLYVTYDGTLWAAYGNTVTVSDIVPGTGATNLGKAEDAVHATGDTGVEILAVRKDAVAAVAADGDYHPLLVDANGRVYVIGVVASGGVASGAVVDGAIVTIGVKTDAKSTATDGTSVSVMQVLKQVSASAQSVDTKLTGGTDIGDVTVNNAVTAPVPVTQRDVYLGAERLTMAGAAQAATLPGTTKSFLLVAEGGDLRYAIDAVATNASAGYIPAGVGITLRLSALTSLSIYGAAGAFANLLYFV